VKADVRAQNLEPVGRLGVLRARVDSAGGPPPGTLSLRGSIPVLGTIDGALELIIVQPPGRRPMTGEAYLRGHGPQR